MLKLILKWLCMWLIPALVVALFLIMLPGCTRTTSKTITKADTIQSVKTEYRDRIVERVDTFKDIQNNFVYIKGDTMVIYRDRWRDRYKDRTDTLYINKVDTCYLAKWNTAKEVQIKEVKVIKWWEWLIVIGLSLFNVWYILRNIRKRTE